MTAMLIACAFCKHFDASVRDRNLCDAFPNGIPGEIAYGQDNHYAPYKGDHGIRYEPEDPAMDPFKKQGR